MIWIILEYRLVRLVSFQCSKDVFWRLSTTDTWGQRRIHPFGRSTCGSPGRQKRGPRRSFWRRVGGWLVVNPPFSSMITMILPVKPPFIRDLPLFDYRRVCSNKWFIVFVIVCIYIYIYMIHYRGLKPPINQPPTAVWLLKLFDSLRCPLSLRLAPRGPLGPLATWASTDYQGQFHPVPKGYTHISTSIRTTLHGSIWAVGALDQNRRCSFFERRDPFTMYRYQSFDS